MPRMVSWTENQYFSLDHDAEVSRITGFDDHCQGHWKIVECGKGYRERRDAAVLAIQDAIEGGHESGEVLQGD